VPFFDCLGGLYLRSSREGDGTVHTGTHRLWDVSFEGRRMPEKTYADSKEPECFRKHFIFIITEATPIQHISTRTKGSYVAEFIDPIQELKLALTWG